MQPLVDGYGRIHRDLRLSVTDRCNFRCEYCMPEEGLAWLSRDELLTFEELDRVVHVLATQFGLESVRLTGGEPTLRPGLIDFVAQLSSYSLELSMTTNGASLQKLAVPLHEAGLDRLNISMDSLRPDRFFAVTKRDRLADVLAGIEASVQAGISPVKVNVVVQKGVNEDEVIDFLHFGREQGVMVRFIEFMPLDADEAWDRSRVFSVSEIVDRARQVFDFSAVARSSAPAERFVYADGKGEFGVIGTVSEPFCDRCDRIRLTADGQLRNCLFAVEHMDLRKMLRSGCSDADLAEAIADEVRNKREGHGIGEVYFVRPSKSMSQLGG